LRRHLITLSLLLTASVARAETVQLRLLETSDRHGHLEEAALLGGYLAEERKAHPGRVLLLDGGDLFTGTLESDFDEGAAVVRAMNALGYDAVAVGNHDFDFGPVGVHATPRAPGEDPRGALSARMKEAKFPFLTTNVVEKDGAILRGAKPFVVRELAGVKVGVVGGTTEDLPRTTIAPNLAGLSVAPLAERIPRAVADARKAGATVVVVVLHAGAECPIPSAPLDREHPGTVDGCKPGELVSLARALAQRPAAERPDAIFGGHTHRPNALVVDGIPVAQGGASGQLYAAITLDVDKASGKATGFSETLVKLDAHHAADDKVAQAVAPDLARAAARSAEPVGAKLDRPLWRAFRTESPLGNLIADELRTAMKTDVGLMNGGGVRADLPAGEIRYGALFEALPFANKMAVMKMSGSELARLFAANAGHDRGVLSIAGATVEVRCEAGEAHAKITLASGKTLGPADTVSVAASDFLAMGGDDLGGVKPSARVDEDGPTLRDVVAAGLKRRGHVDADDPSLYDKSHPRIVLPSARPVHCPR
jgi:5'-nucleotidase